MSVIFKDQGDVVVMVGETVTSMVSEKFIKI